ncbi:hypothetical protein TrLO_g4187 [Triparma laevis f. longispina]|uniref:Uncharacterized protein n=1 Tax=Triparma laevis f. longispina TaxID=1714387 RepID=A0A9W7FK04_9STRA|nr:hypothetical protein TrLO_g4187 [Triparma laevis f. longispina]
MAGKKHSGPMSSHGTRLLSKLDPQYNLALNNATPEELYPVLVLPAYPKWRPGLKKKSHLHKRAVQSRFITSLIKSQHMLQATPPTPAPTDYHSRNQLDNIGGTTRIMSKLLGGRSETSKGVFFPTELVESQDRSARKTLSSLPYRSENKDQKTSRISQLYLREKESRKKKEEEVVEELEEEEGEEEGGEDYMKDYEESEGEEGEEEGGEPTF